MVEGLVKIILGAVILGIGVWLGWRFSRELVARGLNLRTHLSLKDSLPLLCVVSGVAIWLGLYLFLCRFPGTMWLWPEWVELYFADFFTGGFLFAISFLGSAVSCLSLHCNHRVAKVGPAASIFLLVVYVGSVLALNYPIANSLGDERLDGVILQTSGSSCVAASTANILTVLGTESSERDLAKLLRTSRAGTVSMRILPVMRDLGFNVKRFFLVESEWEKVPVPSVIFIDHPAVGREGHAVSLMKAEHGLFEVWDPLAGKRVIGDVELAAVWHGRGVHIWREDRGKHDEQ